MLETEIQIALALLGAGTPDGVVGPKTRAAVRRYEQHVMHVAPTGRLGTELSMSLRIIEELYKPDESQVRCQCGKCAGYGALRHHGKYREGKPEIEAYYQYEYNGVSRMTRWSFIIISAMYSQYEWSFNSGYRCHIDNATHKRKSTNHMGKAIDMQPVLKTSAHTARVCDEVRYKLARIGAQVRWFKKNVMSLEPASIAPTWLHVDCRCFDRKWISTTLAIS